VVDELIAVRVAVDRIWVDVASDRKRAEAMDRERVTKDVFLVIPSLLMKKLL
jgi:hypothetical protein